MSRNNGNGDGCWSGKLELNLNLNLSPSPPAAAAERMEVDGGQDVDDSSNYSSSPRSCMSSDLDDSPGGTEPSPMVMGACERCLMYCMVPKEEYPTCINCKQPCLVNVLPATGDDKKGMVPKEEYPTCINCKQPCLVNVLPATGDDKKGGTGQ